MPVESLQFANTYKPKPSNGFQYPVYENYLYVLPDIPSKQATTSQQVDFLCFAICIPAHVTVFRPLARTCAQLFFFSDSFRFSRHGT